MLKDIASMKYKKITFQNSSPLTLKAKIAFYLVGVILIAAGIFFLVCDLTHAVVEGRKIAVECLMIIGGGAVITGVYFRKRIPEMVKFYISWIGMTGASIALMLAQHGTYRHSPTTLHVIGFIGTIFFGGIGLWIIFNDCMYRLKHREDDKDQESD